MNNQLQNVKDLLYLSPETLRMIGDTQGERYEQGYKRALVDILEDLNAMDENGTLAEFRTIVNMWMTYIDGIISANPDGVSDRTYGYKAGLNRALWAIQQSETPEADWSSV